MTRKPFWGGPLQDKIDIDKLAAELKLPSWQEIDEYNQDYYWQATEGLEREEDESDDHYNERRMEAESEVSTEVFNQWYDAVERAANELFDQHGLKLVPIPDANQNRPYRFRIVPVTSWEDAAEKIRDTINGVGIFTFYNLREFLESGPFTARQAVLTHLHWIKDRPEVYGTSSAKRIYERSWR